LEHEASKIYPYGFAKPSKYLSNCLLKWYNKECIISAWSCFDNFGANLEVIKVFVLTGLATNNTCEI